WEDNRLLVDPKVALEAADDLWKQGFRQEAERLFMLAEPLDLLNGAPIDLMYRSPSTHETLQAWAESSIKFRTLDSILAAIDGLRGEEDRFGNGDTEKRLRHLKNRLRHDVGLALAEQGRMEDLRSLIRS